jgi:hypothetical protein
MICLCTHFHKPDSNGAVAIAIKPKAKHVFGFVSLMLSFIVLEY